MRAMATNFFWFIDDQIAGMARPGSYRSLKEDLEFIRRNGIEIVVSLTLDPLDNRETAGYDLEIFHIPLADGSAPTTAQIERFIGYVRYGLARGKKILVHCGAGYGRTGTMLACYLVSRGVPAGDAIARVREKRPQAIENMQQEKSVFEYERYLKGKKAPRRGAKKSAEGGR